MFGPAVDRPLVDSLLDVREACITEIFRLRVDGIQGATDDGSSLEHIFGPLHDV